MNNTMLWEIGGQ